MRYILRCLKVETVSIRNEMNELAEWLPTIISKDTAERCKRLIKQMERFERKLQGQIADIENRIESIPDADEREMARLYFVDLLGYEEIGDRMFMDRTTVARKIKKHTDKWTCFDNQSIN